MRPNLRRIVVGPLFLLLVGASAVGGQSVAEVVDQMYAAYERQAQGIDNYTLVQSMMGFETTSYFVKETVDGRPVFRLQDAGAGGYTFGLGDDDAGMGDVFLFGPELVEHGRYAGREDIDGNPVHVITVDDVSALDIRPPTGPEDSDMEFTPRTASLYIDVEMLVPRRMVFTGDAETDQGTQKVTMRMDMRDFREVDGMTFPFVTVMTIEGFQAMLDPDAQAELERMEEQLASMPAEQREMMERMMGDQLDRMKEMMGGGGPMTMEIEVSDVRVNAGPPNG